MEQLQTISIPFYKFTCSQELVNEVVVDLANYKFQQDSLEQGKILFDYFHENLFTFFEESVKKVKNIYYKDNLEFPIVDCWVNEYLPITKLKKHNHPNSVICGLFYLTSHNHNFPTIFEYKNPWTISNNEPITNLTITKDYSPLSFEIFPEAGNLILFPSNIFHYMKTMQPKINGNRLTIAFNTFPCGQISGVGTTNLNLQPISLRDKLGKNYKK